MALPMRALELDIEAAMQIRPRYYFKRRKSIAAVCRFREFQKNLRCRRAIEIEGSGAPPAPRFKEVYDE